MLDLEKKLAQSSAPIHPLLASRWSPRSFTDQPVSADILRRIFEAGRWSASSSNGQPWRFIVGVKGDDTWDKVFNCLDDGNQRWTIYAPVLMINIAKKHFERNGRPNAHYAYDLGQALAHMTFQTMAEGLYLHQMGGFYPEKAIETFHIPEDFQPISCAAIGYLGNPEQLSGRDYEDELAVRSRKPLEELVFKTDWEKPFFER